MENISIKRLRVYLNYGVIGFIAVMAFLAFGEELMFVLPILFNFALFRKLSSASSKSKYLSIGLISSALTTLFFIFQYEYRKIVDYSCIKLISDWEANISYASTMILFSIIFWEAGVLLFLKKENAFIQK